MEDYKANFIKLALDKKVIKFGNFILKSNRKSPYFFNMGFFTTGQDLLKISEFYADCIIDYINNNNFEFDILFGPAYKGITLCACVSMILAQKYNKNIEFCYNRKEAKNHGEGGFLVGANVKNKRILIIDDVITAGTAIKDSINILKKHKAKIVGVCLALDRKEKINDFENISAVQYIENLYKIKVFSIVNLDNLLSFAFEEKYNFEDINFDKFLEYRKTFGI